MTDYILIPGFINVSDSAALFETLWNTLPWEQRGHARKECWMNDFQRSYTYGKAPYQRTFESVAWNDSISAVRDQLLARIGCYYEGCFVNGYEGERNGLEWHADDDPGIDHTKPIGVISLGQARNIQVCENGTDQVQSFLLEPGSLFLMPGGSQQTHKHRIPKVDRKIGPRISLTFRSLIRPDPVHTPLSDYAQCNQCGWQGKAIEMRSNPDRPIDEFCPVCGSSDTELIYEDELYDNE